MTDCSTCTTGGPVFDPASEVSRLNAAAGRPLVVSAETVLLVGVAVEAWRLTGGRFDPSVLPALLAAGYDADLALVRSRGTGTGTAGTGASAAPGCAGVVVDTAASTVTLPPGVQIDVGGIAKGLAADMVVADLLDGGAAGACVNVGGDLRVEGLAPRRGGWVVGVADPRADGTLTGCVRLSSGGVATSSRLRRTWGAAAHHLLDPGTGRSSRSGLRTATVVADVGWRAEALAKAAFLAGPVDAIELLEAHDARGLLVRDDGSVRTSPGWAGMAA